MLVNTSHAIAAATGGWPPRSHAISIAWIPARESKIIQSEFDENQLICGKKAHFLDHHFVNFKKSGMDPIVVHALLMFRHSPCSVKQLQL